jgi:hypothetical protein
LDPDKLVGWKNSTPYFAEDLQGATISDICLRATFEYLTNFRVGVIILQWHNHCGQLRAGREIDLYEVLTAFSGQHCSDPRDIVFGFLGIAKSNVIPDYELSVTQLYLYVLVEGLHEIAANVQSPGERLTAQGRQLGFIGACMRAFGFSTTQFAVSYVTECAFKRFGVNCNSTEPRDELEREFLMAWNTISQFEHTRLLPILTDSKPRGRSYLDSIKARAHFLQQVLVYTLPPWLRTFGLRSRMVYVFLRQALHMALLGCLEELDFVMTMPDGEAYTCSGWEEQLEYVGDKVLLGVAPVPQTHRWENRDASKYASTLNALIDHPDMGSIVDWYWQVILSIGLTSIGVKLGIWLNWLISNV